MLNLWTKHTNGKMLVFDLESDGLLDDVTCIHCLVIHDTEADKTYVYNDQVIKNHHSWCSALGRC